jgi:lipopolysaccharide transport system ATP-binding protein
MSDVAQEGRTVLFVSHNMSAILRLTEETIVLENGHLVYRAPTAEAVDFYMASGFSKSGERVWERDEAVIGSPPFRPLALRLLDSRGRVVDRVRSTEAISVEIEYALEKPVQGLRVGIYLMSIRGEYAFTSFDTDDPQRYERFGVRSKGRYISRAVIPADTLNEGRYVIGVNASAYRVKRYFQDERALAFTVDGAGAPGKQWAEPRMGLVRPRLDWSIRQIDG